MRERVASQGLDVVCLIWGIGPLLRLLTGYSPFHVALLCLLIRWAFVNPSSSSRLRGMLGGSFSPLVPRLMVWGRGCSCVGSGHFLSQ